MGQNGSYVGQDVDHDMIRWCQGNIQREGCHFFHADLFSKVYNPGGKPISDYAFPVENGSITLIISVSVFSHLLQPDFEHYIRESKRVLAPGGCLHMTLFLMDYIRPRLGNRWTFSQRIQESYVETLRYPESAVAYDFETVDRILNENSLRIVELYNKELHQQTLIARKEQI
jgi:SAM-dependent methyltransferase